MELMVVIVIMAALGAMALPRGRALFIKSNVRGARTTVINTFQQAKAIAVTQGRSATLNLENGTGRMFVTATPRRGPACGGCDRDTIGLVTQLTTQYGVALNATPAGNPATTYAFDSRGLGANTPLTIELRRDVERDTVLISGFGRVQK